MRGPAQAAPARGTRPRNRRALIVAAASDLFGRRGYDQVSVGDLAEAVAIGPSALYRHFPGKQSLLSEVITTGLAPVAVLIEDLDLTDLTAATRHLAALGLDQRHVGVLWQREARHLAPADQASLRGMIRTLGQRLAGQVRIARPELGAPAADLIAWATISVLISPSFHHLELPRPQFEELLADLLATVLSSPIPPRFPASPASAGPAGLMPASRREALLNQAVRMFAARGYTAVGIEDIGSAVGIAGPSIYSHFPSKLDMLTTAIRRGAAVLFTDLSVVYRSARSADDALRQLVRSYIAFTQANHDLIGLLITETQHLREDELRIDRQTQHDYISEWVHLLRILNHDLNPTTAQIRVHAALTVANDAARTPHLRGNDSVRFALETICTRLLGLG